jgi:5-(carboxyamino)imidazole ribonucleotide synthase
MGKLQDRLTQKQLLFKHKIPTAPYLEINSWSDFQKIKSLSSEVVMKQRRFGYDGYGTFFIKASSSESVWNDLQSKSTYGFIAESKINFKRELALLMARDRFGQIIDFPLVESKQTQARCDWIMGPLKHPRELQLRKTLKHFLRKINYVGVIAFELFDTGKELLVNEIAPRVHNSGHYSIDALSMSQFQAHVLAVVGFKLPKPILLSPFAMTNLLGKSSEESNWNDTWFSQNPNSKLHWYGKEENRMNRKMGHINTLDSTPQKALKKSILARRKVKL